MLLRYAVAGLEISNQFWHCDTSDTLCAYHDGSKPRRRESLLVTVSLIRIVALREEETESEKRGLNGEHVKWILTFEMHLG